MRVRFLQQSLFLIFIYRLTRLVEVYDYKDGMTLISELATGGELLDVVTSNKYITEIEVARIVQQILEGNLVQIFFTKSHQTTPYFSS